MSLCTHWTLGHSSHTCCWVIWNRPGPSCMVFISWRQLHCLVPCASLATGRYLTTCKIWKTQRITKNKENTTLIDWLIDMFLLLILIWNDFIPFITLDTYLTYICTSLDFTLVQCNLLPDIPLCKALYKIYIYHLW